jgi:hypothetical protein
MPLLTLIQMRWTGGAWSQELQDNLTTVTKWGYDIGHLFGATGGGGNAGCIGCVCVNPYNGEPMGKEVLILLLEMAFHKEILLILILLYMKSASVGCKSHFSYELEGTVNVEPEVVQQLYAGITSDYDVQAL